MSFCWKCLLWLHLRRQSLFMDTVSIESLAPFFSCGRRVHPTCQRLMSSMTHAKSLPLLKHPSDDQNSIDSAQGWISESSQSKVTYHHEIHFLLIWNKKCILWKVWLWFDLDDQSSFRYKKCFYTTGAKNEGVAFEYRQTTHIIWVIVGRTFSECTY